MAVRRINVKQLRSRLGISQSQLVRHVWGDDVAGQEMKDRKRTVRRWENEGRIPGPIIDRRLQELLATVEPKEAKSDPKPKRRSVGGMLPSMGAED